MTGSSPRTADQKPIISLGSAQLNAARVFGGRFVLCGAVFSAHCSAIAIIAILRKDPVWFLFAALTFFGWRPHGSVLVQKRTAERARYSS